MSGKIVKSADGSWEMVGNAKHWNAFYREAMVKYLQQLGVLFDRAKNKNEFEFILALLRVRGLEDAGWNSWKNTINAIQRILNVARNRRTEPEARKHLSLWLYLHIVEASEPYETTANLLRILQGDRFNINNFPDKRRGRHSLPQVPSEKIESLKERAVACGLSDAVSPFFDMYDKDLRNAIAHADYSLYGRETRIIRPRRAYSGEEMDKIVNKGLAYFFAFKHLYTSHVASYRTSKIIDVDTSFSPDPQEQAVTMIRRGHGIVGLKDNWSTDALRQGRIPFRIGRFYSYERRMLDKDPSLTEFPYSRIDFANSIIEKFPARLRAIAVKILERTNWF